MEDSLYKQHSSADSVISEIQEPNNNQLWESPAHRIHCNHGAHFAEFGGWNMPVSYAGTVQEHNAVRSKVGLFDVSHLGKVYVQGENAREFINSVLANDISKITPGQAQYTLLMNDRGGVVDDLIVYYESDQSFFLVPNAANTASVVDMLKFYAHAKNFPLMITNAHHDYAVFALQGPLSPQVLEDLGIGSGMGYMQFRDVTLSYQGKEYPIRLCRTGYTGEKGYEIIPHWKDAEAVCECLIAAIKKYDGELAGLGARDTLRTEMGYALHGHELTEEITPVQASLSWAIGWKKQEFIGKTIVEKEKNNGSTKKLYGLVVEERGIPRAGFQVKNHDGTVIGAVTSGTFSPTLQKGIALALLDTCFPIEMGDTVVIDIRNKPVCAQIRALPLVQSNVR